MLATWGCVSFVALPVVQWGVLQRTDRAWVRYGIVAPVFAAMAACTRALPVADGPEKYAAGALVVFFGARVVGACGGGADALRTRAGVDSFARFYAWFVVPGQVRFFAKQSEERGRLDGAANVAIGVAHLVAFRAALRALAALADASPAAARALDGPAWPALYFGLFAVMASRGLLSGLVRGAAQLLLGGGVQIDDPFPWRALWPAPRSLPGLWRAWNNSVGRSLQIGVRSSAAVFLASGLLHELQAYVAGGPRGLSLAFFAVQGAGCALDRVLVQRGYGVLSMPLALSVLGASLPLISAASFSPASFSEARAKFAV